nr:hypothetical protein [Tanacetum cinerariifolium]
MIRNVDSPSRFLMYPHFIQVLMDHQVDDMTTHNTRYKSFALTQKVFTNMRRVGKGFSGVETPLFGSMLVQSQQQAEAGVEVPITHTQPSTTSDPSPTKLQDTTPTPHDTPPQYQPPTPHDLPLQDQPTTPYDSTMPLLNTLMETCATLSQKVVELEKDRNSQALEILQLKKRVKRLERKKKSKTSGLKRLRRVGADQRVESTSDTVLGAKEDASKQGENISRDDKSKDQSTLSKKNVNAASKGVSVVIAPELISTTEPTVFDNEDVKMKMAQTLIKLKAEKARILDEEIAQKLHDEEVRKVAARDEQERADMEKSLELQRQLDEREDDIDWSVVAEQNMLEIVPVPEFRVGGITEAYQNFKDMLKGFDREDLVALRNLVKERFSLAEPIEDKERALWVKLKRLFEPDANDVL